MSNKIDFASKRKIITVNVEELGEPVMLKALSSKQIDEFNKSKEGVSDVESTVLLLSLSIVDENGHRLYTSEEDLENLRGMSVTAMTELGNAAAELISITKADAESLAKKSEASRFIASVSA